MEFRLLGLGLGLFITWILITAALDAPGLMRGASYLFALYMALSNATFIKIARVGRDRYLPLGLIASVVILDRHGAAEELPLMTKYQVGHRILDRVVKALPAPAVS